MRILVQSRVSVGKIFSDDHWLRRLKLCLLRLSRCLMLRNLFDLSCTPLASSLVASELTPQFVTMRIEPLSTHFLTPIIWSNSKIYVCCFVILVNLFIILSLAPTHYLMFHNIKFLQLYFSIHFTMETYVKLTFWHLS